MNIIHDLCGPYSLSESIGWLWRNVFGVRKANPCGIRPLPRESVLNPIDPRIRLGFVGDIMETGGKVLSISPAVRDFLGSCGYLIGNFEGTLTDTRKTGLASQKHDPAILNALSGLFPPERTILSVANNHAGDFPQAVFRQSVDSLREKGFSVFGLREAPFADIAGCVRVVAASMWSNRPCREIARLESLDACLRPMDFTIAYPHWGYELEMFPRPAIVLAGERLLRTYGAVLGHHSHTPQPLTALPCGDVTKLLAFSLGDFCTGLPIRKFQYGMVCKVEIGPGEDGIWRIGSVHWRYTKSIGDSRGAVRIEWTADPVF